MSMRRPACAPPPKICTSGIGSDTGPSSARYCQSGMSKAIAPACATASDTATVALPPSLLKFGVPSSSTSLASISACSRASMSNIARAIGPRTLAIACATSYPPSRVPPSRRSTTSREPRDAPAGAIPRPMTPLARRTSASTVGRPARVEDAPRVHAIDGRRGHGANASSRSGMKRVGCARRSRANARTTSPPRWPTRYSTGDLPSTRASMRPGSKAAMRASSSSQGLPAHVRAIAFDERIAHGAIDEAALWMQRGLQEQVIEQERDVESGIAVPGAFGVDDHRPMRADQDVLGARVPVHEHALRGRGHADEVVQRSQQLPDARAPRYEIGVEA